MQTQEHQWNSPELCSSAFRQDNSAKRSVILAYKSNSYNTPNINEQKYVYRNSPELCSSAFR